MVLPFCLLYLIRLSLTLQIAFPSYLLRRHLKFVALGLEDELHPILLPVACSYPELLPPIHSVVGLGVGGDVDALSALLDLAVGFSCGGALVDIIFSFTYLPNP